MADVGNAADDFVHRATRRQLRGCATTRETGSRDSVWHLLRVKTILSKQLANRLYVVKLRLAQHFGDRAYAEEPADVLPLLLAAGAGNKTGHGSKVGGEIIPTRFPLFWELRRLWTWRTNSRWRAYGHGGGNIYFNLREAYGTPPGTKGYGRYGDMKEEVPRGVKPPWANEAWEIHQLGNKDFCAFIGGAPDFADRTHAYWAGEGVEKQPPSFNTFRRILREGRIFAIVTARGHDPATLRKGVEMFIERILSDAEKAEMVRNLRGWIVCYEGEDANAALTDEQVVDNYLSMNRYHAVTNPAFIAAVKAQGTPGAEKSETRKQFAILDFLEWLFRMIERIGARKPISVGFSDDDPGNVAAVADFIRHNLAERFPSVKFVVYDTSDPDVEKGHKLVVSGQLPLF